MINIDNNQVKATPLFFIKRGKYTISESMNIY